MKTTQLEVERDKRPSRGLSGRDNFVCQCEKRFRSACDGLPFYKEHEGKQYCVLHFPGKEKEADFREALGRKLEDRNFDFAGVYFPGEPNFNFLQFDSGTVFSEATFEEGASFFKATFKEGANFSEATFEGGANFVGATFEGRTNFSDATFKKKAGFFEATFEKEADFSGATFEEEAVFIKASFEKISSRSGDDASKEAIFSTATFEKEAHFSGATFEKAVSPRASEADGRSSRATRGVRLPYLPGIDGLRALAVIAVLFYHAELHWLPGGFLGVDIFFVISGYLIASLLLAEWRQRGRIDLKAFWLGRARRLLPALYLLLAVTLAFAVVFLPDEVARLRNDALAAFGYVTNWYLVLGQQSYFETIGRPSLLQHLWSLAVEEQFYLLWPLLFAAGMARLRWLRRRVPVTDAMVRWRSHRVLIAVIAGAAGSAVLMATLYRPEVDPSRLYYGTDTRATALLVGVALAFVWAPGQSWRRTGRSVPLLLDVAGLAALGGLLFFCLWLDESQPLLFRGGFTLVALTTAVLIMVLVHPHARLMAGLLGREPLRWVGLRSYSIYLWHWPVFMVTRPDLDVPISGLPLLALQLGATLVLADLSYRFVETPIRRGALGRSWRALREARGARRRWLGAGWAGAVGMGVAFCVVLGLVLVRAQPPAPPSYLSVEAIHTEASPTTTETDATTAETASADPITAVGDSVMIGAAGELERALDNPAFGADVGLQPVGAIEILQRRRAEGRLGDAVVVHVGNNVPFTSEQFDEMMRGLAGVRKVVVVNVKVPRPWEQRNNDVLADGVRRYPNAVLVDWHAASADRPELFVDDGIHLQPEGQRVYADLIAAQLDVSSSEAGTDEKYGQIKTKKDAYD